MSTVIRALDETDYRIHFEVTHPGRPAKLYGLPENCYPAEPPEWAITGIDGEVWDVQRAGMPDTWRTCRWLPIERTHSKLEAEAVYTWAEGLDLSDEAVEDVYAQREANLEAQAEARADAIAEINRENER
jgi:hypothetical protein